MRKDDFVEIGGVRCLISSERVSVPRQFRAAGERRATTEWSVFLNGETIARGKDRKVVIERARKALEGRA